MEMEERVKGEARRDTDGVGHSGDVTHGLRRPCWKPSADRQTFPSSAELNGESSGLIRD